MSGLKTTLGIDINEEQINMVLLKKHGDKYKILKVANGPIPEGTIKNGNVNDTLALAKAIKKIKIKNRMHANKTAISLYANPVLAQIQELPDEVAGNIREHINNVVKHYAVLPIKKTSLDFCKISSSSDNRRVLIVATDGQKVSNTIKALYKKGIVIDSVEPGWMAYARACLAKQVPENSGSNLLFVKINKDVLTLSLFKNQKLDFVRIQPIEADKNDFDLFLNWLSEQINAIMKFYEYGISKQHNKWQVNLFSPDKKNFSDEIEKKLNSMLSDKVSLVIRTPENAFHDTPVEYDKAENKPSVVAIGLAMKLLTLNNNDLNINLMPSEAVLAKSREKKVLVIANIAAAIVAIMILSINFFNMEIASVKANTSKIKSDITNEDTKLMLIEQSKIEEEIEQISERYNQVTNSISIDNVIKWGQIFQELGSAIPKKTRLTSIRSTESGILLDGQAYTYEVIYQFVDALKKCENIQSAAIVKTTNNRQTDQLISFLISCELTQDERL